MTDRAVFAYDSTTHPTRLNLGCGWDHRDGYLNVDFQDFHRPDLVSDVRELPMLPTATFDEVMAIDVLEHLPRGDTAVALREWARLLRPGGRLVLQVPDVTACGRFLATTDDVSKHALMMNQMFGTQGYTGDFHLAGFTDLTLIDAVRGAGFHRTELGTRDGWMLTSESIRLADDADARPLSTGWLGGAWPAERSGGGEWRWTDGMAELLLVNHRTDDLAVRLETTIDRRPGGPAIVNVFSTGSSVAFTDMIVLDEPLEARWQRVLQLPPGATRVRWVSDAQPIEIDDPRRLVVRLIDAHVVEL